MQYFPEEFKAYYEPFLGGGSLYFSIAPQAGQLNDMNPTLIHTYETIRDSCESLIKLLQQLQIEYDKLLSLAAKKDFYYAHRDEFNNIHSNTIRKSGLFIFLNKTGFNGMYRENSNGDYNIPFGQHDVAPICNAENLRLVSSSLQHIRLSHGDYRQAIQNATAGDFVYLDPPYHPLSETSSFTEYQAGGFIEADQRKLAIAFTDLANRGCNVMMSNSTADLITELYSAFYLHKARVARAINSAGAKRGKIAEYVITSYNPVKGSYAKRHGHI